MFKKGTCFSLS